MVEEKEVRLTSNPNWSMVKRELADLELAPPEVGKVSIGSVEVDLSLLLKNVPLRSVLVSHSKNGSLRSEGGGNGQESAEERAKVVLGGSGEMGFDATGISRGMMLAREVGAGGETISSKTEIDSASPLQTPLLEATTRFYTPKLLPPHSQRPPPEPPNSPPSSDSHSSDIAPSLSSEKQDLDLFRPATTAPVTSEFVDALDPRTLRWRGADESENASAEEESMAGLKNRFDAALARTIKALKRWGQVLQPLLCLLEAEYEGLGLSGTMGCRGPRCLGDRLRGAGGLFAYVFGRCRLSYVSSYTYLPDFFLRFVV